MSPPRRTLASDSSLFSLGRTRKTKAVIDETSASTSTTITPQEAASSTLSLSHPTELSLSPITPSPLKTGAEFFSLSRTPNLLESKGDLEAAVSSKAQASSPAAIFRQRLVHKASNLKFRIRRKKIDKEPPRLASKVPQQESPVPDPPHTLETVLPVATQYLPRSSTLSPSDFKPLHISIRSKQVQSELQKGYLHKSQSTNHTFIRMASESAQPPVSYSRLQQITTSACEKALGSITSYNHASTEDWNTTIINTILGTLVEETTPQSSDGSAQPPFKFVVNSTIIQHAPGSSGSSVDPAVTGRRGMHAASGAFWSNEKDGMWSYKYSAAENKGFDVVIGIIWIWVG